MLYLYSKHPKNRRIDLHSIALKDLPARKRWRGEVFKTMQRRARRQRPNPTPVSVLKPDSELDALERQHTGILELISELDAQRVSLQKEADKVFKRIGRRKKVLAK